MQHEYILATGKAGKPQRAGAGCLQQLSLINGIPISNIQD